MGYGWTRGRYFTTAEKCVTSTAAAPELDTNVYCITGSPSVGKHLYQKVLVSGNAGDTFVLAGWAKGDSAPLKDDRQFGIIGTFNYTDGTTKSFTAQFNPDTDIANNWQYSAEVMVAEKAYNSIKIELAYDYNVNSVYFDGIQLYREEFGNSYTYDADGNVTSVKDLQGKTTSYEYNTNGDLAKIIQDNKAKMTYTYDEYHNVETAVSEEGLTYEFTYDDYGNNKSVSIVSGSTKITSTAEYSNSGNTLASTTDALGNVTTYTYNANTNVLESVQYPEDTAATQTNYTYDSMYRLATAAATTDTGTTLSAAYTYTNDMLTKIQTGSTAYTFTYGNFALRTSAKVGSRTLANYTYTNDKNKDLQKLAYGNGDSVQYTYDSKGRVTKQTYEDGATVSYSYDNNGALATVTDSETGIKTTYYYDFTDRMMKYVESGSNLSHSVGYTYDTLNNLTALVETINGVEHTTSYAYDKDNRITSVTNGSAVKSYTYDTFGRSSAQTTKNGSATVKTDTFSFNNPTTTTTTAQVSSHTASYGNGSSKYSYTYDKNGNITSIVEDYIVDTVSATWTTTFEYDSANQLIRENNQQRDLTQTWTYDNAGNITSNTRYAYTTGDLGTPTATYTYGYDDECWGDLLTSYNGNAITYDEIGNPLSDGTRTYTWQHGRQLATTTKDGVTWNYTYNADGLRTSRSNGTTAYNYVYNGDKLSQMTIVDIATNAKEVVDISYDATGTPMTLTYTAAGATEGTTYYYITNIQGDVTGITDSSGNRLISYRYESYGKSYYVANHAEMSPFLARINPLAYRSYVYDSETKLYYLQSRYYNPEVGRFINADIGIANPGESILGNNMFAYCFNNPINRTDSTGNWSKWATIGLIVGAALCIAAVTVLTCGVGTATLAGAVAVGAAKGALIGAAIGTTVGAGVGYATTGTLQGALEGAAIGFGAGAVVGAVAGAKAGAGSWYNSMAQEFTNAGSSEVVLGRSGTYEAVAQSRGSTYFHTTDARWTEVHDMFGVGDRGMWNINKAFLNQQISAGSTFALANNPAVSGGYYFLKEVAYLASKGISMLPIF